jgi:hypothetical protein
MLERLLQWALLRASNTDVWHVKQENPRQGWQSFYVRKQSVTNFKIILSDKMCVSVLETCSFIAD